MTIPDKMKAMVLTGPGTWELQEVDVPVPGRGQVLCRIDAVAICGSDPEIIHGGLPGIWPPSYPFIAGHEWAGTVAAVGPDVLDVEVGDRVAGEAHKGCGYCSNCLKGRYTLCLNYGKPETGHRHYGFTRGRMPNIMFTTVNALQRFRNRYPLLKQQCVILLALLCMDWSWRKSFRGALWQ